MTRNRRWRVPYSKWKTNQITRDHLKSVPYPQLGRLNWQNDRIIREKPDSDIHSQFITCHHHKRHLLQCHDWYRNPLYNRTQCHHYQNYNLNQVYPYYSQSQMQAAVRQIRPRARPLNLVHRHSKLDNLVRLNSLKKQRESWLWQIKHLLQGQLAHKAHPRLEWNDHIVHLNQSNQLVWKQINKHNHHLHIQQHKTMPG